jgi:hypothetical protein
MLVKAQDRASKQSHAARTKEFKAVQVVGKQTHAAQAKAAKQIQPAQGNAAKQNHAARAQESKQLMGSDNREPVALELVAFEADDAREEGEVDDVRDDEVGEDIDNVLEPILEDESEPSFLPLTLEHFSMALNMQEDKVVAVEALA